MISFFATAPFFHHRKRGDTMNQSLLDLLQQSQKFHSLRQIAESLDVKKNEAEHQIRQLQKTGYQIQFHCLKGYRLKKGYLNSRVISSLLKTEREVFVTANTTSTNDWAASMSRKSEVGSIFLAEQQTRGRGRQGRQWDSPFGEGLFLSVLGYPDLPPCQVMKLTLCAGMAVCKGIEDVTGMSPQIKWPNDIVLEGKKVSGILAEMKAEAEQILHVVMGIGVNVNQTKFPKELNQIATSLKRITGKEWDKNRLAAAICNRMAEYEELLRNHCFPMEEYRKLCVTLGREVRVIRVDSEYSAKALTVTDEGELVVQLPDGAQQTISSGEVSVRGLFGYI